MPKIGLFLLFVLLITASYQQCGLPTASVTLEAVWQWDCEEPTAWGIVVGLASIQTENIEYGKVCRTITLVIGHGTVRMRYRRNGGHYNNAN